MTEDLDWFVQRMQKWSLITALLLLAHQAESIASKPAGNPGGLTNELFSSGQEGLEWDSDELQRIRQLHQKSFNDKPDFLKSKNLADYLGLSRVDAVHLPVPVNVLLVGFDGHGNKNVNISGEEFASWFSHMDHVIPHTRVPLSELSCQEQGSCTKLQRVRRPKPLHSYVHLNLAVHAVEVDPAVSTTLERASAYFSRPVYSNYPQGPRMVDATNMEQLVEGLLTDLNLHRSYTILLYNPAKTNLTQSYSYQAGLSQNEIRQLTKDEKSLQNLLTLVRSLPSRTLDPPYWGSRDSFFGRRSRAKFSVTQLHQESQRWTVKVAEWLQKRENIVKEARAHVAGNSIALDALVGTRGFHGEADLGDMLSLLQSNSGHRPNATAFGRLRVMEPEEGCMVDTWVGHERWLMMDLTVLGQDWGPYLGGDGIKTYDSLPQVAKYFKTDKSVHEDRELANKLAQSLETMSDEVAKKHRTPSNAVHDVTAGIAVENKNIPEDVWLSAELDVYEAFALEHCKGKRKPPPLCSQIEDYIDDVIDQMSHEIDPAKFHREHAWDIFGGGEELTAEIASEESRTKDLFMAHLSSVMSRAVRHVFIPPSMAWQQNESLTDMSLPYSKHVAFTLYLISDPVRKTKWGSPNTEFDVARYKSEVKRMMLPSQKSSFSVSRLTLLDNPGLSTAVSMSMHSSNLHNLHLDSNTVEERLYFDSKDLGTVIRNMVVLSPHMENNRPKDPKEHLDISIVVLSLDRESPVFIDHHYIARALPDMVIVVHNMQERGQHPLGITCNGNMMGQTLGSPLKFALSATLQHLGGLLPPHLGYSPAHRVVTHDWMWSVGAHPFSLTSPGWKLTQSQLDALHRRYVLDALDTAIDAVNQGIEILESQKPSNEAYDHVVASRGTIMMLLREFSMSTELWRQVATDAGELEFDRACAKIERVLQSALNFYEFALKIKSVLHPVNCGAPKPPPLGVPEEMWGGALLIVIGVAVYFLMPRKQKKKSY